LYDGLGADERWGLSDAGLALVVRDDLRLRVTVIHKLLKVNSLGQVVTFGLGFYFN
jgi:hypothetical protein